MAIENRTIINVDTTQATSNVNSLADSVDRLGKGLGKTKQDTTAAEGSYAALSKQMSELKKAWKATADEAERGVIGKQIVDLNNKLKGMDASIGNYQRNVGNYAASFKQGIASAIPSVGAMDGALKGLAANPIGAAITILVGLFVALKKGIENSESSSMRFSKAMSTFKPIINGVTNVLQKLVDGFVSLVEWIGKAVITVTKFISQTADFLGMDTLAEKTRGWADSMELANEMQEKQNQLTEKTRKYDEEIAKYDAERAEALNELATNEELTYKQRIELTNKAKKAADEAHKRRKEIAEEELRLLEYEASQTANNAEMNDKLAAAKKKVADEDRKYATEQKAISRQTSKYTKGGSGAASTATELQKGIDELIKSVKSLKETESPLAKINKELGTTSERIAKINKLIEERSKKEDELNKINKVDGFDGLLPDDMAELGKRLQEWKVFNDEMQKEATDLAKTIRKSYAVLTEEQEDALEYLEGLWWDIRQSPKEFADLFNVVNPKIAKSYEKLYDSVKKYWELKDKVDDLEVQRNARMEKEKTLDEEKARRTSDITKEIVEYNKEIEKESKVIKNTYDKILPALKATNEELKKELESPMEKGFREWEKKRKEYATYLSDLKKFRDILKESGGDTTEIDKVIATYKSYASRIMKETTEKSKDAFIPKLGDISDLKTSGDKIKKDADDRLAAAIKAAEAAKLSKEASKDIKDSLLDIEYSFADAFGNLMDLNFTQFLGNMDQLVTKIKSFKDYMKTLSTDVKVDTKDMVSAYSEIGVAIGQMTEAIASHWQQRLNWEKQNEKITEEEYKKEYKKAQDVEAAGVLVQGLSGAVSAYAQAMKLGPIAGPIVGATLAAAMTALAVESASQIHNTKIGDTTISSSALGYTPQTTMIDDQTVRNIGTATAEAQNATKVYVVASEIEAVQNATKVSVENSEF